MKLVGFSKEHEKDAKFAMGGELMASQREVVEEEREKERTLEKWRERERERREEFCFADWWVRVLHVSLNEWWTVPFTSDDHPRFFWKKEVNWVISVDNGTWKLD